MIYTTYNPATGQIYSIISESNGELPTSNDNIGIIEGAWSGREYLIIDGQPQQLPIDPSNEYSKYNFDYNTKNWVLNQNLTIFLTRHYRNNLMSAVDRVNPVWYNSLSIEQQAELITYRQALLDVPQQSGFPESVEWPAKPAWL